MILNRKLLFVIPILIFQSIIYAQNNERPAHDDSQLSQYFNDNLLVTDNSDGEYSTEGLSFLGTFDRNYSSQTSFEWENLGLYDEARIQSGSVLSSNGVDMIVNWHTETNGGSFYPFYGQDFLSYESGACAGDYGIASMGFKSYNDPNEKVVVNLNFSEPITGLNFSVIDIDTNRYSDDGVEIFYNGNNNVKGTSYVTSYGYTVSPDNEYYMNGFEGNGYAANGSNGNINLNFYETEITSITIKFSPTDDGCNFSSYFAGISDLCFIQPPVICEDNLLQNPGFESCNLSGWYRNQGEVCITSHANSGNYAAKLRKEGAIYQDFYDLTPGAIYTFTASGKVTNNCHGQFGVKIYGDTGYNHVLAHEYVEVSSSNWNTYTVSITVPDNASVLRVYGYRNGDGCSTHSYYNLFCHNCLNCEFYLDDACLTIENQIGSICGQVKNDFGIGLISTLNLLDNDGNQLQTFTTNQDGTYCFNEVEPGDYTVVQIQPDGYDSVSDQDFDPDGDEGDDDTTVDNKISVRVTSGETDNGNDFIDTERVIRTPCDNNLLSNGNFESGSLDGWDLSGATALVDTGYYTGSFGGRIGESDGTIGRRFQSLVLGQVYSLTAFVKNESDAYSDIALVTFDENENVVALATVQITSSTYEEFNLSLEVPLGAVALQARVYKADGTGYVYLDDLCLTVEQPPVGAITGLVKDIDNNPIQGVTLNLLDANGNSIAQVITAPDGTYLFSNVNPGRYVVEQTQPNGFESVSDQDETNDGDAGDTDTTIDNRIEVIVQPGETDSDNNFVEEAILIEPGSIAIEQTVLPGVIRSENQKVTYIYTVTNPSNVPMANVEITNNIPCQQAIGYNQLQSGDTNNNGLLEPNEEWIYSSTCNFKWVQPESLSFVASVQGVDLLGETRTDSDIDNLNLLGTNMEVQLSQNVASPGDIITVRLIVRLLRSDDFVQFRNVEIATNLIGNSTFMPAGPVSPYWVDPTNDIVNSYPGAFPYALDANDGADFGDYADWVHEFEYTIPEDAPSSILVEAWDVGNIARYEVSTNLWNIASFQWAYDSKEIQIIGSNTSKSFNSVVANPFGNQYINYQLPKSANYNDSEYRSNMKVNKPSQIIGEVSFTKVKVIPNPATDYAKLLNSEKFYNSTFTITNMYGQILKKGTLSENAEINVQSLLPGRYVIQLEKDGHSDSVNLLVK